MDQKKKTKKILYHVHEHSFNVGLQIVTISVCLSDVIAGVYFEFPTVSFTLHYMKKILRIQENENFESVNMLLTYLASGP